MEPDAFDKEYFRRLQLRDPSTEAHLIEFVGAVVREQLKRYCHPTAQFDELFQETFVRVLSSVRSGKLPRSEKFAEFVTAVCRDLLRWRLLKAEGHRTSPVQRPASSANLK